MYIDTHAHINFNAFKDDAGEVIKRSLEAGVFMINIGSQYSTSKRAVEMAEKYESGIYSAVGLHPIHINDEKFDYEKYLELAKKPKVVAIGEMGLDYYHSKQDSDKGKQKEIFLEGIKLANKIEKPMVIHCREAYNDLLEILKNNPVKKFGVAHSFCGSLKTAQQFIELGYKIGLNGIITYSPSYDKLIKNIALEDILLETDCPYLNPKPLPRDGRNEPENVKYVAGKISHLKNTSIEEVKMATTRNAKEVFGV
ncbi:MAG: hypothetical protein A3J63_01230 [Candidatus Moranbacteria bacterium RIFCSPHIGHO2_02_FULL_40_12b]|nr:MAG: hypothetical protein A3J63_01230 [Candidatus Moranbacteria bacterium RIFCSPHIGHO2_02_FULL_40_12b]OGI23370.1 MAG: hypothetical protein A3E91_00725 [Candidatus Moranbacteria bacterium RIFCSPHIGHO2_12_FULL_40_10]